MKTKFRLGIPWLFSICLLNCSWSQDHPQTKEMADINLTISQHLVENEAVGDVFQDYTDYIARTSKKLSLQGFEFHTKSFTLYRAIGDDYLQASIDLSFSFVYDPKKINAFSKALRFDKAAQWALSTHIYKDN
ncbi:hypothetical protein [Pseudozobellia thermophila]|uniref:Uncharacterized protein n=1 Tax=Pseudozobellia thermophila TaxID=192903 RepID=A0A1M6EM58_9FLAO|nr:hypothetical protein [Pseudozobellia thermophila]SHI86516.1 hypothetical protein SAMN04488513_102106 [Pseudozobellia thermophila]